MKIQKEITIEITKEAISFMEKEVQKDCQALDEVMK